MYKMNKGKMKREVTDLISNASLAKQFDESYWSADCEARHKCKVQALHQCDCVKAHYFENFEPKYDTDSDCSIYSVEKIREQINYKYSEDELNQIIAALGNCLPFYAHLYNIKASNRVQILCPFSRLMAPWK